MGTSAVARKKSPDKTPSGPPPVGMRAQPHGGTLRSGGTNKGGPGRPPWVLREQARALTEESLPQFRLILLGEKVTETRVRDKEHVDVEVRASIDQRLAALAQVAELGLGEELRSEDVRKRLEHQAEIIVATLGAEDAQRVLQAIAEAWQ